MARIRTIKPEFWTDEALTECSVSARLLFIGIWNFADDNGNIERSAKQMKMKIFPADNIDVEPLVVELLVNNLLVEYQNNNHNYLNVRNFFKHQIINRPSKNGHPKPTDSGSTHVPLTEYSLTEGKGREGKGREIKAAAINHHCQLEPPAEKGVVEEKQDEHPKEDRLPVSEALKLMRTTLGRLTEVPGQVVVLQDICRLYPPELIREAFTAAQVAGATRLNWVVQRLAARGRDSPASTKAEAQRQRNYQAAREFCGAEEDDHDAG